MDLFNQALSVLKQKKREEARTEADKLELLSRPDLVDKLTAQWTANLSPSTKKPKYGKFATRSEAVTARMPDDHPMRSYAEGLKKTFTSAIADPRNRGHSAEEILSAAAASEYGKRLQDSYKFYREDDSFIGSELRKPIGYDQWHEKVRASEQKELDKEGWLPSLKEIGTMGALGPIGEAAVGSGVAAWTGAGVLEAAAAALAPEVAIPVAIGGALASIPAHVVSRLVKGTELYRANAASNSWVDKTQAFFMNAIPELGTFAGAERKLTGLINEKLIDAGKVPFTTQYFNKEIGNSRVEMYAHLTTENDLYNLDSIAKTNKFFNAMKKAGEDKTLALPFKELSPEGKLIAAKQELRDGLEKESFDDWGIPGTANLGEMAGQAFTDIESDTFANRALSHPAGPTVGSIIERENEEVAQKAFEPTALDKIMDRKGKAKEALKGLDAARTKTFYNILESKHGFLKEEMDRDLFKLHKQMDTYITEQGIKHVKKSSVTAPAAKLFKELGITSLEDLGDRIPQVYSHNVKAGTADVISGVQDSIVKGIEDRANADLARQGLAKDLLGQFAGMAKFGVPLVMFAALTPTDEADAGVISSTVKGMVELFDRTALTAAEKYSKEFAAKGLIAESVKDELELLPKHIQTGFVTEGKDLAKNFTSRLRELKVRVPNMTIHYSSMSPDSIIELVIGAKKGVMMHPAVQKASFYMAEIRNVRNAKRVIMNISDSFKLNRDTAMLRKEFSEIDDLAADFTERNFHAKKVDELEEQIDILTGKKAKGKEIDTEELAGFTDDLEYSKKRLKELNGAGIKYSQAYNEIAQRLAPKSQSLRVTLALDSHSDFKKYPWLKDLLTDEDKAIIGRTREFYNVYKQRLEDRGIKVIKEGYMHHPTSKDVRTILDNRSVAAKARYDAQAYGEFYSRTNPISMPIVPDYHTIMEQYITRTERTIHNHDFWNISGWKSVMNSDMVTMHPGLKSAFDNLYYGSNPLEWSRSNQLAAVYANVEVFKRLFLSTGAAFKHGLKMMGTIASLPTKVAVPSVASAMRHTYYKVGEDFGAIDKLIKLGLADKDAVKVSRNLAKSMIGDNVTRQLVVDAGMDVPMRTWTGVRELLEKTQDIGSYFINTAEFFDRALSVEAAGRMAAKNGMSYDQALYGIYNQILTNNFLSREFNPTWLRSPKIRATLMFQSTPFKIMQRRVVAGVRAGRTFISLGKGIRENPKVLLEHLGAIHKYIKEGEAEFKATLLGETLMKETDFFGTPIANTFMKEMLTAGGLTYGAAVTANMSLESHFFHIPFMDTRDYRATLALNPAIQAAMKTYHYRELNDDQYFTTQFFHNWLGSGGVLPMQFIRMHRASIGDVPDIYGDGKLRYLRYFLSAPDVDVLADR